MFSFLIIGFIISSARSDIQNMNAIKVVQTLFSIFWYNLITGILIGVVGLFYSIFQVWVKRKMV